MHTYDAHGLPYFISSSGVMQFREACYTAVSYAPYILLQIYTITILATFGVTILEFFHPGPQPICSTNSSLIVLAFFSLRHLMHLSFVCPASLDLGYRGQSGAKVPGFNLRCVPTVPWMCRGFNFPLK